MDLSAEVGQIVLASRVVDLGALEGHAVDLSTVLPRPLSACEVRLHCKTEGGVTHEVRADISAVEIECDNKRELHVNETRQQRLQHFNLHVYGHVEGYLGDRMWQIVNEIGTILETNRVTGNIAEFGVHHGLFLFLLNTLRNDDEVCFAIDLFDEQPLNVDCSGRGSLSMFLSHVETLMAPQRRSFRVVQRDTMSFSIIDVVNLFGAKGVKFFSIDAGHTVQHTSNDLILAQEVLVPGGIVALDDYMSVHWPGVTEGFYRFMHFQNRRLKPFLFFQNKLFLTTVSEHGLCLQQFRTAIEAVCGDEVRGDRWKTVEIAGSNCLSFA